MRIVLRLATLAALTFMPGVARGQSAEETLMFNAADNAAAWQLAVDRCDARWVGKGEQQNAVIRRRVGRLFDVARGRLLADVRTALKMMGRENSGEIGETVVLCRMIGKTYIIDVPGSPVQFPEGSMWLR